MPDLQLHQLRVAAVAKMICSDFHEPINERNIILACLFHDMGNILKFDFTILPEFLQPEGLAYWQKVKTKFEEAYGLDEHRATSIIAREIGLPEEAVVLIEGMGFSKMQDILHQDSHFEIKIVEYGDNRVSPHGVVSIAERFDEGRQRYARRFPSTPEAIEHYRTLTEAGEGIERQIFSHTSIRPEDINDDSTVPLIEELWEYPVS